MSTRIELHDTDKLDLRKVGQEFVGDNERRKKYFGSLEKQSESTFSTEAVS